MAGELGINKRGSVSYRSGVACCRTRSSITAERTLTMPLRTAATLFFAITLTTGCSAMHGDPKNPERNPHPVKRYEVTATVGAPGAWDSVTGTIFFDVANVDCVPQDSFTGGRNVPNTSYEIEMSRINENTWKGYFLRDYLQDDDYYDLGVCHWDVTGLVPSFTIHGKAFNASILLQDALNDGAQEIYFKKSDLLGNHLERGEVLISSFDNEEVVHHPDGFFTISVGVKEATP
ncbi:MAG TPA: hypothetical protein VLZ32_02465 [Rhodanobacter sp.]|nr:hypothetical protein [Rhodanobacter sp.]